MRPTALHAIGGGFAGTVAITAVMYFAAPLLIGMPIDVAGMLGEFLGVSWWTGMTLNFINGTIIFPLIYAYVLYDWLPGNPTMKGITWGVALWFVAQIVIMPIAGAGFFSAYAGGMMAAIASLLGHIIYGGTLGAIAGGQHRVAVTS